MTSVLGVRPGEEAPSRISRVSRIVRVYVTCGRLFMLHTRVVSKQVGIGEMGTKHSWRL